MSTALPLIEPQPLVQPQALMPIAGALMSLAMTVGRWEMRLRTRKALVKLDDHQLRDIGISRAAAAAEWDKPFWWE